MTDGFSMTQLQIQLQQAVAKINQLDHELAKLQGHCGAVELVAAALVLTHPNLSALSKAIAENRPELTDRVQDQMFAFTLGKIERTIAEQRQRREGQQTS